MVETILITGATGNVGSEVVKQLFASSLSSSSSSHNLIKAAVHSPNKADQFKWNNKKVEIVNFEYDNAESIAHALTNVDKLFFLVNPVPNKSISSSVVKEAKKNDVKHIVMLSSIGVNIEPETTVGRFYKQEEKIIEESGIPYTILRPNAFMQNFVNFYGHTIKTQDAFYLPAGDGKISFVDVRDIAAVAVQELTRNGSQHANKVYEITGQEALSFSQAAEIISREIGRKISYIDITEKDSRKGMQNMGMEDWIIDAIIEPFSSIRDGFGSKTTTVVEQITGRKPISFSQFVKDYEQAFK